MATLITGGAGFLGSHLMERLIGRGEDLVCLDDFNDYYSPEIKRRNIDEVKRKGAFRLYEGDIRDAELCARIFAEAKIDKVVHLAARAGVRASLDDPLLYQDVNCRGTMVLIDLAAKHSVSKFVSASSSSVYGNNKKVPFAETDWVGEPVSPYAATKRAGELFCHACHHLTGMPIVCLRFFTAYGPRQRPDMAIHKFTRLMMEGKPIPMFGDGSTQRDYTYYTDIVDGIVASLDADLGFEIINLGESHVVSLRDMIAVIEKNVGKKAIIKQLPEQPGDVKITYADVSKAKRLLGYSPSVGIEEGIKAFVEWYKQTFEK